MKFIAYFIICIVVTLFFDIGHFLVGLVLVRFPSTHRRGVCHLALSFIGCRFCTRYCKGPCDGSCGNWTCPRYHC